MIKISSVLIGTLVLFSGCGGGGDGSTSSSTGSDPKTTPQVVINEVLADNNATIADPDLNRYSDWIELKNISSKVADLSGFGLSDSEKKIKWKFPDNTTLQPGGLLLVWADDFNVTANPNPVALHTNFKLKSNDDKVVLYDNKGTLLAVLNLKDYKTTRPDVSVARNSDGTYILTNTPTPNRENSSSEVTVSKTPDFSHKEGVYKNPISLTITAGNGATIYYTLDGSKPTTESTVYAAPIQITANKTTVKAIAKEPGNTLPSKIKSKTYVIVSEDQRDIVINEIFSDNNKSSSNQYRKYDWVELYNPNNIDITLNNYKLSDKKNPQADAKTLDGTITANSYKVFFIEKDTDGFALSDSGDSAVLYKGSTIIDFEDFGKLKGVSYSRQGGIWDNNFTKTTQITPNAANAQQ